MLLSQSTVAKTSLNEPTTTKAMRTGDVAFVRVTDHFFSPTLLLTTDAVLCCSAPTVISGLPLWWET